MLSDNGLVPRFHAEPKLSSASAGWAGLKLERHHLSMQEEISGTIAGYQICFNLGDPAQVHWKVNGRRISKIVGKEQFSLASHGSFRCVQWRPQMHILLVSLSARLVGECCELKKRRSGPDLIEHFGHDDAHVAGLLYLLYRDLVNGSLAGALYGEQLGVALAMYLVRRFTTVSVSLKHSGSSLPGILLHRICDYVEAHLSGPISLTNLAVEAGMSRFYFSRLFRSSTGQTPSQFVLERRIEKAKTLLSQSEMPLQGVALACGFSSQSHLTSVFKLKTGGTPARYRTDKL